MSALANYLYHRLDPHVWESDRAVIRMVRKKIKTKFNMDPARRGQRKSLYRAVLESHRNAQEVCRRYAL